MARRRTQGTDWTAVFTGITAIATVVTAYFLYQQVSLARQDLQPLVSHNGVECPPYLSNPAYYYVGSKYQPISFALTNTNTGKSTTTVSVYIEKYGVNFSSTGYSNEVGIDYFKPIPNQTTLMTSLIFDNKGTPVSYSFNLNPSISNAPPAEISFHIYYTYTMLDGMPSPNMELLNCRYVLNESSDKSTWAVLYNLKT